MADWDLVWAELKPVLESSLDRLMAVRPAIKASVTRTAIGNSVFGAHATLMRDRLTQEFEDLVMEFVCFPSKAGGNGDTLAFGVQRGTGSDIASLEQVNLSTSRDSMEYQSQVLAYVDRVRELLTEHFDQM